MSWKAGGHDGPSYWSRYPLLLLYGGSLVWVICFLIQKKKRLQKKERLTSMTLNAGPSENP